MILKKCCKKNDSAGWSQCNGFGMNDYNMHYTYPYNKEFASDILSDEGEPGNLVLSANVRLGYDSSKTHVSPNVLVVGSAGTGKTRYYIKPNIVKGGPSFIVTDAAGEIVHDVRSSLETQKYAVKVVDFQDYSPEYRYNPMKYIHGVNDAMLMAKCLLTDPERQGDPYFIEAETRFLASIILYVRDKYPEAEQTLPLVAELTEKHVNPEDEFSFDKIFADASKEHPDTEFVQTYKAVAVSTDKTLKSIITNVMLALKPFMSENIKSILTDDNVDLATLNLTSTALFIKFPTCHTAYDHLIALLITQAVNEIYLKGEAAAARYTHIILDEAGRFYIPNLELVLSTSRKYKLNWSLILQSIEQLKAMYPHWSTIVANCGAELFLGSCGVADCDYISSRIGGLLEPEDVLCKDPGDCIVRINGVEPFYDKKFNPDDISSLKPTDILMEEIEDRFNGASLAFKIGVTSLAAGCLLGIGGLAYKLAKKITNK